MPLIIKLKKDKIMRIMLILAVLACLLIEGCGNWEKCETPPWNDSQIKQLENNEVDTVTLAVFKF